MNSRIICWAAAVAAVSFGNTQIVQIQQTHAQAIVWARTDQAGNCTYRVAKDSGFSNLVDDVNPSIFSGSNSDARSGSVVNGKDHTFVAGTRAGAAGLDSLVHSRSLQVDTHYFVGVTCGGDAEITSSFTTLNLPLGDTYAELPNTTTGFGNYPWPAISWTDQSKQYTDPMTGVVLKRVTAPGWFGAQRRATAFDSFVGGAGWTNPSRLLNGTTCDGTAGNCAQTGNTNKIFVAMNGSNFNLSDPSMAFSGFSTTDTLDDLIVLLNGLCSGSGTDCQVNVCLSYFDSATCNTATQVIALQNVNGVHGFPANGVGAIGSVNTWTPQFQFGDWGGTPPLRGDYAGAYGTVTVSGGVNVTLTSTTNSYNFFNVKWTNAFIKITGSGCTDGGTDICKLTGSPADPEHLTLLNASANVTNANYYSMASGALIWKNTSTGTVTIGATYGWAYSALYQVAGEGDFEICHPLSTTVSFAADGITPITPVQGNLCFLGWQSGNNRTAAGGSLFLLIPSTGEVRLLSPLFTPPHVNAGDATADQNFGGIRFALGPWDRTNPLVFYGIATSGTAGLTTSIFSATYDTSKNFKAYSHAFYACDAGCPVIAPGSDPAIGYPGGRWSDDPIIYANVTKPSLGKDVYTQMAANNPQYDRANFPSCGLDRVLQGYAFFTCNAGSQDTFAVISSFDLTTGLVHGNGDSFTTYPARWGGDHSSFQSNVSPGYYALSLNPPGGASSFTPNTGLTGIGPQQITPFSVLKAGSFSSDTSLTTSSPLDLCPVNPFGISGSFCVTFHTQDVCSHSPSTAEKAKWPCPYNAAWSQIQPLAAGDGITVQNATAGENLQIISSTPVTDAGCGVDCVEIVAGRAQFTSALQGTATGWKGYAVPPGGPAGGKCNFTGCTPGIGIWLTASATNLNSTWLSDPIAFAGHADAGTAPTAGNITFVQSSIFTAPYHIRYDLPLASQAGSFANANVISSNGPFNGIAPSFTYQSYPSNEQYNARINEKRWFLDFHHANGSSGFTSVEAPVGIEAVSYSLAGGTTAVYKFSTIAGQLGTTAANYKNHSFGGYAGRWLFHDVSSPATGNIVTDSTPFKICLALNPNECRSGASIGDVYVSVPNVPSVKTNCYTDWLTENLPCAFFASLNAAWMVQMDGSQSYSSQEYGRRISMALTGYGRQYQFNTFIAESTGNWGFFKSDWADGIRSEVFMARLPAFPPLNPVTRNVYINYPVQFGSGSTYAEVQFGYAESGPAGSFFCTGRQESCNTSSQSGTPYNWEGETRTLTSCTLGCTIQVPSISRRVLYYRMRRSADGVNWINGPVTVAAIP